MESVPTTLNQEATHLSLMAGHHTVALLVVNQANTRSQLKATMPNPPNLSQATDLPNLKVMHHRLLLKAMLHPKNQFCLLAGSNNGIRIPSDGTL